MSWYLEVLDSPRLPIGIRFKLIPGASSFTFGREKSSDKYHIRIPEMNVSRSHAIIFCRGQKNLQPSPFICDMGSVIGTFVNDIKISETREKSAPYLLSHEDEVLIGQTLFKLVNEESWAPVLEESDADFDFDDNPISYNAKVKKFAALSRMKDDVEKEKQSALNSPIPESNIGFKMLKKLGWQSGQGLGKDQQGLPTPIDSGFNKDDRFTRKSFGR